MNLLSGIFLTCVGVWILMSIYASCLKTNFDDRKKAWEKEYEKAGKMCKKYQKIHRELLTKGKNSDAIHRAYNNWLSWAEHRNKLKSIGHDNNYIG